MPKMTKSLVAKFAFALVVAGGASPAMAGPHSNTKFRVQVTNDGTQVIARGAFSETYNAGDGSYLYCENSPGMTLCAAYDASTGIQISCQVKRAIFYTTPACHSANAADCAGLLRISSAPTWDVAILNSISAANEHLAARQFFTGLNDDSYIEFTVPYGTTGCANLRTLKGHYISPKVQ